jgi:hypothetical protein
MSRIESHGFAVFGDSSLAIALAQQDVANIDVR